MKPVAKPQAKPVKKPKKKPHASDSAYLLDNLPIPTEFASTYYFIASSTNSNALPPVGSLIGISIKNLSTGLVERTDIFEYVAGDYPLTEITHLHPETIEIPQGTTANDVIPYLTDLIGTDFMDYTNSYGSSGVNWGTVGLMPGYAMAVTDNIDDSILKCTTVAP